MKIDKKVFLLVIFLGFLISCSKNNEKTNKNIEENDVNENIELSNKIFDDTDYVSSTPPVVEPINSVPIEFMNKTWVKYFGEIDPVDTVSLEDIQKCSWHNFFTFLQFSEQENYAMGDPWSGADFGRYELNDNTITFIPPLIVNRFNERCSIEKLYYSNELYYEGTPLLVNEDESIIFYPNDRIKPEIGDIVKKNQIYCEVIHEVTKLSANNILYALPNIESKNLFLNNYYGNKSIEAKALKLARAVIDNIVWYYVFVDFSGDEPTDGGGPYYYGWLPEEYLE